MSGGKVVRMIKQILLMSVLSMFSLTGCAASGLVHDKNYLRAVAITERENSGTELTLTFFTGDGEAVTVSGEDISGAMKQAEIVTGKPVFTGYTELVVLGECQYDRVLEMMLNDWKVSPSCIVTHSENGGDILSEVDGEILVGTVRQAHKQGKVPKCDIITVLGEILDEKSSAEIAELTEKGAESTYQIKH